MVAESIMKMRLESSFFDSQSAKLMPYKSALNFVFLIRVCRDTLVRFRTLPGMQDLLEGSLLSPQLRDISVENLLRRPPSEINLAEIAAYLTGKTVLITGAGGSIGSEICRQVLAFQPKALLMLGHGENSIYLVHQAIREAHNLGHVRLVPIVSDA